VCGFVPIKPVRFQRWVWGLIRTATYVTLAGSISRVLIKGGAMEAYCVKCKAKREMKDAKQVKMKNGRAAMKGRCPTCGTGLYRIMGS